MRTLTTSFILLCAHLVCAPLLEHLASADSLVFAVPASSVAATYSCHVSTSGCPLLECPTEQGVFWLSPRSGIVLASPDELGRHAVVTYCPARSRLSSPATFVCDHHDAWNWAELFSLMNPDDLPHAFDWMSEAEQCGLPFIQPRFKAALSNAGHDPMAPVTPISQAPPRRAPDTSREDYATRALLEKCGELAKRPDPAIRLPALRKKLCARMNTEGMPACDIKQDLLPWENRIEQELTALLAEPWRASAPSCFSSVVSEKIFTFYEAMLRSKLPLRKLLVQVDLHSESPPLRVTGMDLNACLEVSSAEERFTLCNSALSKAHALKDPWNLFRPRNQPILSWLLDTTGTGARFGSANCHGTASEIAAGQNGTALHSLILSRDLQYFSSELKSKCEKSATAFLKLHDVGQKPLSELPALQPGGVLVNMDHTEGCSSQQCGKTSLLVHDCNPTSGSLVASVFVEGMCVECWGRMLEEAGYPHMDLNHQSWPDLKPGCILTAEDHTITLLIKSQGVCYAYEATTPYGPGRLIERPCPELWSRFPRIWCPKDKEMEFTRTL